MSKKEERAGKEQYIVVTALKTGTVSKDTDPIRELYRRPCARRSRIESYANSVFTMIHYSVYHGI